MVDQLYVGRDGKRAGPYSPTQLRAFAASHLLHPTDTIWKEGMEKAVSAVKVKNLFSAPPSQPPPPDAVPGANGVPTLLSLSANPLSPGPDEVVPAASSPAPSREPASPDGPGVGEVFLEIGNLVPLDLPGPAEQAPPKVAPVPPKAAPVRKWRAIGQKGAILLGQDGVSVQFRKKCSKCGFEEASRSTLQIRQGVTRVNFYCPKCRKNQDVLIQGVMQ